MGRSTDAAARASRSLAAFYALAILISWGYWLGVTAPAGRVLGHGGANHLPGLLGPALAAAVVTAFVAGGRGLRELGERCLHPPRRPLAMTAAMLVPLLAAGTGIAVEWLQGRALPPLADFLRFPGLPDSMAGIAGFALVLVLNGLGEEVGWRGFAFDRLAVRNGRFGAAAGVVPFWLLWHAPMFAIHDGMSAMIGPPLIGWAVGLACGGFVLAYLYEASGRSIAAVALWHTLFNFATATPATAGLPAAIASTVTMLWGLWIAARWWRRPGRAASPSR